MKFLYNIGILTYWFLVRVASLKNPKAKRFIKGRKHLLRNLKQEFKDVNNVVWVHCASLGEFEQGRPLIDNIKESFPDKKILLTFYSPSGYEVRKDYPKADYVYYLPIDTPRNARRFIKYVKPETAFFIKYEYWINLLRNLKKNNIPVYFVSSIFRRKQLFFKKHGKWYRKALKLATHFFVQNSISGKLLKSIGINNYTITGDTRFDRVAKIAQNASPLPVVENFCNNHQVIVAGSSWKAEEALILQYLRTNKKVKVILAPHEVKEENINRIMQQFGDIAILHSQARNKDISNKQVLVIDGYGLLTSLYQYGTLAVIGGGFGVGIHNTLEAATYGMPIIFGNNYRKFKEAIDLVRINCAFPVNNIEEFNTTLNHLLNKPDLTKNISEKSANYVVENIGATQKIINHVYQQPTVH
ncbi:MAG: 3-deoxy-D-manno-octulosonic acid transferase [Prolixibacteraceae bacterium]|nr:3-deoxy-D-manno-octulosonic acid transferase [Prolixibacteraceae bacterium]